MHETPRVLLQQMSCREYAAYCAILGDTPRKVNGVYWSQVRPFFFRPLLPFLEYVPEAVFPPGGSIIGGFQFAVPTGVMANSRLNYRMFENADSYSLQSLDQKRRRQVRLASNQFSVKPFEDVHEFTAQAYPVYQSFDKRTHYRTGAWRRQASGFAKWASELFKIPKIVVLGGYDCNQLRGVCVFMCVEDTVVYATSFCDTESLRRYISDLLLHSVRVIAARHSQVAQVFAGMCIGERGLDEFYALRGCKLVEKPAILYLNPLARGVLRVAAPSVYKRLLGR